MCAVFQSAKTNLNVEQVFFSIARDIKQRLAETDSKPEVQIITLLNYGRVSTILFGALRDLFSTLQDKTIKINKAEGGDAPAASGSACCGS